MAEAEDTRFYCKRCFKGGIPLWQVIAGGIFVLAIVVGIIVLAVMNAGPEQTNASIAQIQANPERYMNENVTVSGSVTALVGDRGFVLGGTFSAGSLLVLSADPLPSTVVEQQEVPLGLSQVVQVTGQLRQFDQAELEQELGMDFDEETISNFGGQPVLVAQEIVITP